MPGCDFAKPFSMAGASPKGTSAGSLAGTCSDVTIPSLMARLQTVYAVYKCEMYIIHFVFQFLFPGVISSFVQPCCVVPLRSCTSSTSAHRQYLVRSFRSPDPLRSAGQLSSKTWTIKLPCSAWLGSVQAQFAKTMEKFQSRYLILEFKRCSPYLRQQKPIVIVKLESPDFCYKSVTWMIFVEVNW